MPRPAIVFLITVLALGASAANAQVPGLRRARDAAARRVTGQPADPNCVVTKFDGTTLELDAQVVARLLRGLEARSKIAGPGGQTATQLRDRAATVHEAARELNDAHGNERFEFTNKKGEADNCVTQQLGRVGEQHAQEMQQRFIGMTGVNTPEKTKFMQDYMAASTEAQQASAAGDTAGMRRASEKINKLFGWDAQSDSAKARAACHVPATPAWMTRADSLVNLSNALYDSARVVEVSGNAAAGRAAEMTPEQFRIAAERAEMFLAATKGGAGAVWLCPFSEDERKALAARRADLQKYFG